MMITGNERVYPVVEMEEGVSVAADDERGLTIREHFAAMAMQGMLAACQGYDNRALFNLAKCAVLQADALITELNKDR